MSSWTDSSEDTGLEDFAVAWVGVAEGPPEPKCKSRPSMSGGALRDLGSRLN